MRHFNIVRSVFLILCLEPLFFLAQTNSIKQLKLSECLQIAFQNNEQVKVAKLEFDYSRQIKKAAYELPKTNLLYTQGQFNSIYPFDNIYEINQIFPFPTALKAQSNMGKKQIVASEIKMDIAKTNLEYKIKEVYYTLEHLLQEGRLLFKEDSIYELFLAQAEDKMAKTALNKLERATIETQAYLIESNYLQIQEQINDQKIQLQSLLRINEIPEISLLSDEERILVPDTNSGNRLYQPNLLYLQEQISISEQSSKIEKQRGIPDLSLGYFNQSIYGPANIYGSEYFLTKANRLQGFKIGLTFPLFFLPHQAKVKASGVQEEIAKENYQLAQKESNMQLKQAINKYLMTKKNLDYYKNYTLISSRVMVIESLKEFNANEINYIEYLTIISKSVEIAKNYLNLIYTNNMAVIQIEYLLSNKK